MIYLASPYSHPSADLREERYLTAMKFVVHYASLGLPVYSPVVHWHEAAKRFALPTSAKFWERQNKHMLQLASCLAVLELDGWEGSAGVQQELEWAQESGIPIINVDPYFYATIISKH